MFEIAPATYEIPKEEGMHVPGLVIATEALMKEIDFERPLQQVKNVAHLPGIVGHSIAMPDIHWGYGFPIGGVAAFNLENGVISPGGVGYDINCGVRLAILPIPFKEIGQNRVEKLIEKIYDFVPSGVGKGRGQNLNDEDYKQLFAKGARFVVERGMGFEKDLDAIESNGVLEGADFSAVSDTAKHRGRNQLGSIGSGNHFAEVGEIGTIFNEETARKWGIEPGLTYLLIHSGSRGFGHQICQDTLDEFLAKGFEKDLPDKQLVAAPLNSSEGKRYFAAMAAAANFAFANRQTILHEVRSACKEVLGVDPESVRLIYDICHNIAKFEEHGGQKVCVHRKGATRAFGPGAEELSPLFRETGQPVFVPGDMGRASHIMVGLGNPLTFSSSCHGAGRAKSRIQSSKHWKGKDIFGYMREQGVIVKASSGRTVAEEMPNAYKDVDQVVDAVEKAGCAAKVARLTPKCVIKG